MITVPGGWLRYNKIWLLYFFSKIFYLFFALFVYSKFTILGDSERYVLGPTFGSVEALYDSTYFMDFWGLIFSTLFTSIGAHFIFSMLSFYGVYFSVSRGEFSRKSLIIILAFLSFPSFGVWTSIASKESVIVFCLGIILGSIFELYNNQKVSKRWLLVLCFYVLAIFKPHYFAVAFLCYLYVFLSGAFRFSAISNLFFSFFCFLAVGFLIYSFRHVINELSFIIPHHFDPSGGTTRENIFWLNDWDFFTFAPKGMVIAFIGPTFSEALAKTPLLIFFVEGILCFMFFFYSIVKLFVYLFVRLNFDPKIWFLTFFSFFGFLFAHYPFGIFNAGSAVRYREGFFAFLVVLYFFLQKKLHDKRIGK